MSYHAPLHLVLSQPCANGQPLESIDTCVAGLRGTFPTWTPLPANFKNNGYLTLGVRF